MNTTKQQKGFTSSKAGGFTIIEVVLVLAIAALIFLMIFVALPALQRGQANTARKNDMSTVASAVNTYRTNTNGTLPSGTEALNRYIDNLSQSELIQDRSFATGSGVTIDEGAANYPDVIKVVNRARCSDDGQTTTSGTSRQAAVLAIVETSADNFTTVCQNA